MTARRAYREEYEPVRPQPVTDLPLFASPGEAARDRVLTAFEVHKSEVVRALRVEAWRLWRDRHKSLSANDLRPLLARIGYTGDTRILIAAFRGWTVVGMTTTNAPGNHARKICLFEPRASA